MTDCNSFTDFSTEIIKLDNLFKKIHLESINLFEDVKSVKIVPYCIPAETFTNDEICFENTEIHNLENLKLENIELGRSTIHKKKNNRFLYVSHKFDKLVISGTTDIGNQDKFNTSIFKSNLIVYRDYNNQGVFNLEIPFLVGYSESNSDKYVAHAVDMYLKRVHDMTFHLPVRGFNGLLDLLENKISTPTNFFPENITFGCEFLEKKGNKGTPYIIYINTNNMRLNKQLNYDVFNKVKFVEMGGTYNTQFDITFNKLAFSSKIFVTMNGHLLFQDDVQVEMKKLQVQVDYLPNRSPMYKLNVDILNGLNIEKKSNPYSFTSPFQKKLSDCIKATTLYNIEATLVSLKFLEKHPNVNTN